MLGLCQGDARHDRGSDALRGANGELSIYQTEALAHADKAESTTIHRILPIEADAFVSHGQTDSIFRAAHFDCEVLIRAVLNGILQSFLKNAKQAEGNFSWNVCGYIGVDEFDLDLSLFSQLTAETLGSGW